MANAFKDRLATAITDSGKTQRDVALATGIHEQMIGRYLQGMEPREKNRAALIDALPLLRELEIEALK